MSALLSLLKPLFYSTTVTNEPQHVLELPLHLRVMSEWSDNFGPARYLHWDYDHFEGIPVPFTKDNFGDLLKFCDAVQVSAGARSDQKAFAAAAREKAMALREECGFVELDDKFDYPAWTLTHKTEARMWVQNIDIFIWPLLFLLLVYLVIYHGVTCAEYLNIPPHIIFPPAPAS